ncbi:MAG: protease pro-enzyme activation domain-containing protein [Solirubrobacteraceae bacterium]
MPIRRGSRLITLVLPAVATLAAAAPAHAATPGVAHATVALAPRNAAALATYAEAVATPGSSVYHHYLTPEQFVGRFGPSDAEVARVRHVLRARGIVTGALSDNRLALTVDAGPAGLETDLASATHGRATAHAAAAVPSLPRAVAGLVQGIITPAAPTPQSSAVVEPRQRPTAHGLTGTAATTTTATDGEPPACPAAQAASTADGSYMAGQIASAYGMSSYYGAGDQGAGVTIALYELEPFSASDVAAYQACYGTDAKVRTVAVDGGAGSGAGSGEAAMDIETVIGLAAQASIDVYEGPATGLGAYRTYNRIIGDDSAQVISTSWGTCEAIEGAVPARAEATLFEEAAVQGQTVIAATGDQGANDCGNGQESVDDPGSQPWVTAVGATSLQASGNVVWDDTFGATGGGASRLWSAPAYQRTAALPQIEVSCGAAANACREVPDLSIDGDPATGYTAYYLGAWRAVGGSSVSAPAIAALTALADASPACGGHSLGFLNTTLYHVAAADPDAFGDVTAGSNDFGSVAGFAAGPGYDMASGLGTPTAALGPDLCRASLTLPPLSAKTSTAGRFASLRLRASTAPGEKVIFAAFSLPTGMKLDRSTGRISGTPTAAGKWRITATATTSSGGRATTAFDWVVRARTVAQRVAVRMTTDRPGHRRTA